MVRQHSEASMLRHKPVYLDGEPIGCAATVRQAAALARDTERVSVEIEEQPLAFHVRTKRPGRQP
jgi:hypothetical protein